MHVMVKTIQAPNGCPYQAVVQCWFIRVLAGVIFSLNSLAMSGFNKGSIVYIGFILFLLWACAVCLLF